MRSDKLPYVERLMIFASLFSFGILFYRCIFSLSFNYTFLLWNLLIAFVPYFISKQLIRCKTLGLKAILLLLSWLVLFPCSIYLFTDLMRLHKTNFLEVYDIFMLVSFAFTGILPGLMSLKHIEMFLKTHIPVFFVRISILLFIFLSSYNIVLVRFLHLKSWDVVADFKKMYYASEQDILSPGNNMHTWLTILVLVFLIDLMYAAFKQLYRFERIKLK